MSSHAERSAKMPDRSPAAGTRDRSSSVQSSTPASTTPPHNNRRRWMILGAILLAAGGVAAWLIFSGPKLPHGFAGGNGRLEANQVYVASKYPGRVLEVLFNEGDTVDAGQ